jgi:hypothetical protein
VILGAAFAALLLAAPAARAQVSDARRLGMGGILLSEDRQSAIQNVAYRAVPRTNDPTDAYKSIPLPLGLIQVIADPPEFDSKNPNFNVFQIMQLISRTPYTLQLIKPEELSSDIIVDVGQNQLVVDLGDLQNLFPDSDIKLGTTLATPNLEFGTRNIFGGVRPQSEARNSLDLDPTLQAALAEAAPFTPNTIYGADDDAQAQAALAFMLGGALPVLPPTDAPDGNPRKGGKAIYVGARAKYLRGIALWRGQGHAQFATGDTIFGSSTPIETQYDINVRQTPDPGFGEGNGFATDAGVVFFVDKLEVGIGVNDIAATIDWKDTNVDNYTYDSVNNENVKTPVSRHESYKSRFPTTGSLNLVYRTKEFTFGGTLDRTANELWVPRVGMETWLGPTPLRGGLYVGAYSRLQVTAGSGIKIGKMGLDLALATHSRGLTDKRGLELAASLSIY